MNIAHHNEEYISEILSYKLKEKYNATLIKFKTNQRYPNSYNCIIKRQNGSYFCVDISKNVIDVDDLDRNLNAMLDGLRLI